MATSSFFTPLVVKPEDEDAMIKVFESKEKVKWKTNKNYKFLNDNEVKSLVEKMRRSN